MSDQDTASGPTPTDAATPVAAAPSATTALLEDAPADGAATDAPAAPAAAADAPAGDKPVEADGKPAADAPPGAPEEYADFTMPEGFTLDPEVTGDFKGLAKELNLPQEKAQQVVELGTKLVQRIEAKHAEQVSGELAKWAEASKTDKEFGGDLLQESLAGAKAVLNTFGTPELKEMLNTSGLGNNPEVIRLLHRVSKAISEDRIVGGKPGDTPAASTAQRMYPGMNP